MKKLTLFLAFTISLTALNAQQTCITATNLTTASSCNYSSHTTTGTDYWLKFTATSPTVNISLVTVKFDLNATHIHNLALYSGSCSNPILVADDELPFVEDAKELAIDLNASGLVVGQSYYLKATRLATHKTCDKGTCTANGSTNPTVFDICIQDIDVIIPLDFGLEQPSISHAYTTNRGQLVDLNGNLRPEIKLYTINSNPQVYLSSNKIHYVFSKTDTSSLTLDTLHRFDMGLVNALPTKVFKTEQTTGLTNYYLGHIPQGVTNNKSYSRAVCNEIYPNIDVQYYSNSEGIKQYFIVKPGGDANNIILKFDGATAINVTPNGGLEIITSIGTLDFEPPHAYQVNNGNNIVPMPWQARFIQLSANTVKFDIRNYPENMPLFIQVDRGHSQKGPSDPEWSTYFGGSGNDFGYDITNDNNGNIFVVGETRSNNFPVLGLNIPQSNNLGGIDGFVAKFDINYEQNWTTYYGGGGDEMCRAVVYSGVNDKIYISGEVFGSPQTPFISTQAANSSSFVSNDVSSSTFLARFNNQFGMREWATYFGGSGTIPTKMAVDNLGNIYVVGYSVNYNTPITGCTAPTGNGNGFNICNANGISFSQGWINGGLTFGDGFIAKFTNTELVWSTFIGGVNDEIIYDIIYDDANQQMVIGGTSSSYRIGTPSCSPSSSLPLCGSGGLNEYFQTDLKGVSDGFLSKFTVGDNKLVYSTYFGGAGDDAITGIASTSKGNTYFVGFSNTFQNGTPLCATPSGFGFPFCPSTPPAYSQNQNGTSFDSFIARLNEANGLEWSTFFGGDKDELFGMPLAGGINSINKIFVTNNDDVIIVGNTQSGTSGSTISLPTSNLNTSLFFEPNHSDQNSSVANDTYVSLFDGTTNELRYSSYFGGLGSDNIGNVTAFQGRIYITGGTNSNTLFPINCPVSLFPNPFCQQTLQGGTDVFISQIRLEGLVGVEDRVDEKSVFSIFPNPTNNNITIKLNEEFNHKDISIEIYDIIGQLSYSNSIKKHGNNHLTINVTHFPKGIYLVKLQMEEKNYSAKFVKQ